MYQYFGIGSSAGAIIELTALSTPVVAGIVSDYLPYQISKVMGDLSKQGYGPPSATWTFAIIGVEERNELKTFCPDASAQVYIHTKKNDDTWAQFSCTMNWPDDDAKNRFAGQNRTNLVLTFTNLVEIIGS